MAFLLLRGEKLPAATPDHQRAALIGLLLLAVGNGLVTVAEHQKRAIGHCCRRGHTLSAIYAVL